FNWALLHLRDLYAPNVRLAVHVSDWATGTDISTATSSSLDANALGQQAGSFAAQSGISGVPSGTSSYDLLFNDVSDRDAGYYKYVYNNPNAFWYRLNVTFPNFQRWETYVGAAGQATGRPVMVWQVPEGNQYFDSENNTNGHYQDNRAEYFFGHVAELAQAGIIGVLFGAGNAGSTVHVDDKKDGNQPAELLHRRWAQQRADLQQPHQHRLRRRRRLYPYAGPAVLRQRRLPAQRQPADRHADHAAHQHANARRRHGHADQHARVSERHHQQRLRDP